jgi:hypothetical protein
VHSYLDLACERTSLEAARLAHATRCANEPRPFVRFRVSAALCAWEKGSYRCDTESALADAERERRREEGNASDLPSTEEDSDEADDSLFSRSPPPVKKRAPTAALARGCTLKKTKLAPVPYPGGEPPLRLYFRKLFGEARPEIHVFDCHNDLDGLSSDRVVQCYFVANAPDRLLHVQHTLGSAARYMDAAVHGTELKEGRNFKELFCVDAKGTTTLKMWLKRGRTMRELVTGA